MSLAFRKSQLSPSKALAALAAVVLLFTSLFAELPPPGPAPTPHFASDPSACNLFMQQLGNALIGRVSGPKAYRDFGSLYPHSILSEAGGAFDFESTILHQLENIPPSRRNISALAQSFGTTPDHIQNALLYYGLLLFGPNYDLIGETPSSALNRFRLLEDLYRSSHPKKRAEHLKDYYLKSITQKSIPQIARDLHMHEAQVYSDLSLLQISIHDQFSQLPHWSKIQDDHKHGIPIETIASTHKVGVEALRFILHALGRENRGVSWDRFGLYDGKFMPETQILVTLWDQDRSISEIAQILNTTFATTSPHDNFRTENSVSKRLQELGLTTAEHLQTLELIMDGVKMKENGHLIPDAVINDYLKNPGMPSTYYASRYQITASSWTRFCYRHRMPRLQWLYPDKKSLESQAAEKAATARRTREKFEADFILDAENFKTSGALGTLANSSETRFNTSFGAKDTILALAELIPTPQLKDETIATLKTWNWTRQDGASAKIRAGVELYRIWKGFTLVIKTWNADPQNQSRQIDLDSLLTPDGLTQALQTMHHPVILAPKFKESGALDTLANSSETGFTRNFGAKDTILALAELIPSAKLREDTSQTLNTWNWKKWDGRTAKHEGGEALFRIWKGLSLVIATWNADPQNQSRQIDLDSLFTPDGLTQALQTMRHPIILAQKFKKSGALTTLANSSETAFSTNFGAKDTILALAELIPSVKLREDTSQTLNTWKWKDWDGRTAKATGGEALFRIWKGLSLVIKTWNADPQNQSRHIDLDSLLTPNGLTQALQTMRQH